MINHDLTPREAQAVQLLAFSSHTTNKAIGEAMAVSERTIEAYLSRAREKTGTGSRIALLRWGREHLDREPVGTGTGADRGG